jgi:AcrR family transcriptional regulator
MAFFLWYDHPVMGQMYHESMATSYTTTGRSRQKLRTRQALVDAARVLLSEGRLPSVEAAARAAGISRTTAYRYFSSPDELVQAAHPEVELTSLLDADSPDDPRQRLDLVLTEHFRIIRDWEPELRASLAASLRPGAELPVLRQGRAIGWIVEALSPLDLSQVEKRQLAVRVRAVAGIEPLVWLVDVAGLSRRRAFASMRENAHAVLEAAVGSG